eukprot:GHVN01025763.1.p1 GENE.GHVN01025763.1~~GHVN01025763.1.p1  ORF type:complete len:175 (-),score=0.62 GHVN01025763.1:231-755(-)
MRFRLVLACLSLVPKSWARGWTTGNGVCYDSTVDPATKLAECELPVESPTIAESDSTWYETVRNYAPNNDKYPCNQIWGHEWKTEEEPERVEQLESWRSCMSLLRQSYASLDYVANFNHTHCSIYHAPTARICVASGDLELAALHCEMRGACFVESKVMGLSLLNMSMKLTKHL